MVELVTEMKDLKKSISDNVRLVCWHASANVRLLVRNFKMFGRERKPGQKNGRNKGIWYSPVRSARALHVRSGPYRVDRRYRLQQLLPELGNMLNIVFPPEEAYIRCTINPQVVLNQQARRKLSSQHGGLFCAPFSCTANFTLAHCFARTDVTPTTT